MFRGSSCTQTTSLQARVARQHAADLLGREGVELLDAGDRHVGGVCPLRRADQVDSRPCRCTGRSRVTWLGASARRGSSSTGWNAPSASSARVERRQRVAQQALGRHHAPAAAGRGAAASACRRSRWKYCAAVVRVGDAQVVLGGELQEALEPGAGVLRALPFVAVRQQQHQRRASAPTWRAPRDDELVDDHLGAVGEVAVLRLPEHQRLRARATL